ncbi:MAG: type II toxin-antitoxin system PemK/MazF family toxin [Nitrospirae bacterium]|nr:type II toxin-antitoxin system PemK/MazF family toxin [Nitrospirota bacterium]
MKRGDLYRVYKGTLHDPKKYRIFVIVSRQILIDSKFSTVICAPVYSSYDGLSTQVRIGIEEGLKYESSIHCDELVSIQKTSLRHFIGTLSHDKIEQLNQALKVALSLS